MALMTCRFFSDALMMQTSCMVIMPQQAKHRIGMDGAKDRDIYPTLLLLHGLSDDETTWMRRTSIERYAAQYGIAVVMPTTHRCWYTDTLHGPKYWTYISEELPRLMRQWFPLSPRREDLFVAGLSMGGYGAFKMGTRRPDLFSAAASLSGALDLSRRFTNMTDPNVGKEMEAVFGGGIDSFENSENDVFHTTRQMVEGGGPQCKLLQICGTEDFLYAANQRYRDLAQSLSLEAYAYEEGPGAHEWGFWDTWIQRVLAWLPLEA